MGIVQKPLVDINAGVPELWRYSLIADTNENAGFGGVFVDENGVQITDSVNTTANNVFPPTAEAVNGGASPATLSTLFKGFIAAKCYDANEPLDLVTGLPTRAVGFKAVLYDNIYIGTAGKADGTSNPMTLDGYYDVTYGTTIDASYGLPASLGRVG